MSADTDWAPVSDPGPAAAPPTASDPSGGWVPVKSPARLRGEEELSSMGPLQKLGAGFQNKMTDTMLGAQQLENKAEKWLGVPDADRWDKAMTQLVDYNKEYHAPLHETTMGHAGEISADVTLGVLLAPVPGADTFLGGAVLGGALGAAQPVGTGDSRLLNAAAGATGGVAGVGLGKGVGKGVDALVARAQARATARMAANAPAAAAQQSGYVLTPSMAGDEGLLGNLAEAISGKIKTQQSASLLNQQNTNNLVKRGLRISSDQDITPKLLQNIRSTAGQAYDDLRNYHLNFDGDDELKQAASGLGHGSDTSVLKGFESVKESDDIDAIRKDLSRDQYTPEEVVALSKKWRQQATNNLRQGPTGPVNPDLGYAYRQAAGALESLADRNLRRDGYSNIADDWRHARSTIAAAHDVESALVHENSNNVDARQLGKLLDRGKPFQGPIRQAAEFGNTFGKVAQTPEQIGSHSPFTVLDTALGALGAGGLVGGAMGVHGMYPLALAAARPAIRAGLLTGPGQRMLANPAGGSALSGILQGVGAAAGTGAPAVAGENVGEGIAQ